MKLTVFLCGLALAAASPTFTSFHQFKVQYGRQYATAQEERYRSSVYDQNMEFIEAHNEQYTNGEVTYMLAINQFGDMTNEEINAVMNGLLPASESRGVAVLGGRDDTLPAEVDWRTKGAVTPVKDQKACGSCWAFSATGSLEGQHFLKDGKLVSLSEQNLVDCSTKQGDHGCGGGLMDFAFTYIKDNGGIDTEASYPYEATDGKCQYNPANSGATVTGYVDVEHDSEDALQKAVATIGPISVAIDASRSTFHFYHKGVYYDKECSSTSLDHGVLAVGYGTQDGTDYWLVKNSWNITWGNHGFIEMSRNRNNNCGIATQASYPLV
uniref:Cathepsin L n=1 Tax=Paralithodes camtschaticus TaxID=6741 RepID=E5LEX0_PARCM|nr:cathepsin L [Paralithodes camtschaticus]